MNAKLKDTSQRLVLVCPGYNCSKEISKWWNSIVVQNYPNWQVIAIDDMSTDDTYSQLTNIASKDNRLTVIRNLVKKYQARNWYEVINNNLYSHSQLIFNISGEIPVINPDDIIIFMDMDDWFGSKYVFEDTIKEFMYRDILCMTARNFQLSDYYNHDAKLYVDRDDILDLEHHEYSLFCYKAELFQNIPEHYFREPDTKDWYKVCGDYLITLPILWQAGPAHHHHLFKDNYIIYNNIRLECDDNKVDTTSGMTEHELAWPKITKSFREMAKNNELKLYR